MMSLRSSPMPDLTDDLVEEILARVPTTSLKRLRSTCKKWNTLFSDGRFTKKHYDKAEKEYLHLMLRNYRLFWMSVNLYGLHDNTDQSAIELNCELGLNKLFYNSSDGVNDLEVFHCNGFLLCTNMSSTVFWNPCTGQTKWILTKSDNELDHNYALGYVNTKSCHDYKIIRFLSNETFELEIYEFNSGLWRVSGIVNPDFKQLVCGVSVKGNTYWIAYDTIYDSCFIISFDFTTERFGSRVCLPFQGNFRKNTMGLYSVREERLSVLFHDEDALKTEIWMTNDIIEINVMVWSIFLRIDLNTNLFFQCVYFFIGEENKFVVVSGVDDGDGDTDTLLGYIIGEDRCRIVKLGDEPYSVYPHMLSYVPSLVQI